MNRDCTFCRGDFSEESITEYNNWDLQLFRDDQYYLGRTAVVFKNHVVDIADVASDEREELFETVIPELQLSLDTICAPDLYNYAKIGNDCRHLHLQIVPRYKTARHFDGRKFEDEYWNQTYSQEYERVILDEDRRGKLRKTIRDNLC